MTTPADDLRQQRLQKLSELRANGTQPYGGAFATDDVCAALAERPVGTTVTVAGRLTAKREHGKSAFADVSDHSGRLQVYVKKDIVGEEAFDRFVSLDLGDWVGVTGELFETRTKQMTVQVASYQMLSKSLRSMPEKWHGLKDQEMRYRQRYLDLMSNTDVRAVFALRAAVIRAMRQVLDHDHYLEVETPMMHPLAGGAAGEPFTTHHRALDLRLCMRLAPELYLKRLLVGGFSRVYEIGKSFRNEGISPRHNPEFTMLEAYAAFSDVEGMMALVQRLITEAARAVLGATTVIYQGRDIHLDGTWKRLSFAQLVEDKYGVKPSDGTEALLQKLSTHSRSEALRGGRLSRSQVVRLVEEEFDPETQGEPLFITDYWTELSPLAKTQADHPELAERFELYVGGMEVANGYSELNDPLEQRARFEAQVDGAPAGTRNVDDEYVEALEYGMPPAGGLGIGIDRMVMILADQPSIRDVILFPLMRPTATQTDTSLPGVSDA